MLLLVLVVSLHAVSGNTLPTFDHGVDLPTTRPLNIAHRGDSGRYPEHTKEAFASAIENGADVIECDVTVTKDLQLICSHEAWLSATTDIADIFPDDRKSSYFVIDQGRVITDFFSVDFTLDELTQVRSNQRNSRRDPNFNGQLSICSFEEYIQIAQSVGRPIGIYPETKDPIWINSLSIFTEANTTFEDLLLDVLEQYGYTSATDPCFIQSFNEGSIRYMSERTHLPIIMLGVSNLATDSRLDSLAEFCYGIGPSKRSIVSIGPDGYINGRTDLIKRAHARGLRVHPYTIRNEYDYLAWDYGQDHVEELIDFFELGADGLFTDFPRSYTQFLNATYSGC